jgi:hypothetical protein
LGGQSAGHLNREHDGEHRNGRRHTGSRARVG